MTQYFLLLICCLFVLLIWFILVIKYNDEIFQYCEFGAFFFRIRFLAIASQGEMRNANIKKLFNVAKTISTIGIPVSKYTFGGKM